MDDKQDELMTNNEFQQDMKKSGLKQKKQYKLIEIQFPETMVKA